MGKTMRTATAFILSGVLVEVLCLVFSLVCNASVGGIGFLWFMWAMTTGLAGFALMGFGVTLILNELGYGE